jgi:hypothetical protein
MMRTRLAFAVLFVIAGCSTVAVAQTTPATQPVDPAALEKQFEATLTNVTLVGHFTTTGSNAPPKEDRYHIVKVTKQQDGNWLFQAGMRYAAQDLLIPLVIPVKWAGDTAVIQVTGMRMPGGSGAGYSARVLIYGDQYAGTWSSPKHGGHLFGRIEKAATTQPASRGLSSP